MGLLGPYQDVLTPKEFVPEGQLIKKLEPFLSTNQQLCVCMCVCCCVSILTRTELCKGRHQSMTEILYLYFMNFPRPLSHVRVEGSFSIITLACSCLYDTQYILWSTIPPM